MITVDVNLLLYAVIDAFPQHEKAHAWWESTLNGNEMVGLASPAIFGFLRIATNRRVMSPPLTVESAIGHVRDWLDRPNVRFLCPEKRHLDTAFDLLSRAGTAGNLTTDVQLAAYAIEHNATMYSNDTDFARFDGLRCVNPLRLPSDHGSRRQFSHSYGKTELSPAGLPGTRTRSATRTHLPGWRIAANRTEPALWGPPPGPG